MIHVKALLQNFIILIENQFSCKLKIIRFDNEKKLVLNKFILSKKFFMRLLVFLLSNKMILLKGKIDTYFIQ